ncbi:hypothetical protein AQUCO_03000360v1 [Aquilegia coerulea]|uniref:No apical meristem-associated C-terminal domain-containing protein n=1 Tax=Aquilegia coerulea TaxID=218851 RepID=A0A2G5D2M6_AQUCA|nr:hypothetical protein AQUCO_03000360v1 [Aquilegia coerulea]
MESQSSYNNGRGPNFTLMEDETICKAWLSVKEKQFDGSTQMIFWDRVLEAYNKLMGAPTDRDTKGISRRWSAMQQSINVFCGFLNQLETTKKGDTSLQSRIVGAKRLYSVSKKCPFKWEGCWEILKDHPNWKEYQMMKTGTTQAKKKIKRALEIDSNAIEGASSTPTTPVSQPTTPALIPLDSDIQPTSMDALLTKKKSERLDEKEKTKNSEEQINHLSKVVEESNSLLKTFISSIDERLGRSEDIARRNLQLKEEKFRQRQLEMRERQFERDRKIMDMNLDHMPPMQRQFYELKQREICDRWNNGGPEVGNGGNSGGELEEAVGSDT